VKSYRKELGFNVPARRGFINITPQVETCLRESGIREGLTLVNAMHITASVFINDDERELHQVAHSTAGSGDGERCITPEISSKKQTRMRQMVLRLEMLWLEVLLLMPRLVRAGAVTWGLVLVGGALVVVLALAVWERGTSPVWKLAL